MVVDCYNGIGYTKARDHWTANFQQKGDCLLALLANLPRLPLYTASYIPVCLIVRKKKKVIFSDSERIRIKKLVANMFPDRKSLEFEVKFFFSLRRSLVYAMLAYQPRLIFCFFPSAANCNRFWLKVANLNQ